MRIPPFSFLLLPLFALSMTAQTPAPDQASAIAEILQKAMKTFWNAQWGTPIGANETTNIDDMITTAVKVGSGALISKSSYEAMTGPHLLGFGKKQDNCAPSCFTQVDGYNYGIGIVRSGSWLMQNPLLGGYSATEAYLPSRKIAIAVATTFTSEAFDSQGNYGNASDAVFRLIGAYMAPTDAPPMPKKD